ncbi:sugar-binding protein [Leeuwenhoekiella aequorea]|uniref:sugar-binding protein n=1 Tax=Leeuwenhoekiella aequorea TaxID=283736 RepID=UPI00352FCA8F
MDTPVYKVKKATEVTLSGNVDDPQWNVANNLTDFKSPWDNKPVDPISFRALYDEEYLYFSFVVTDNEVYTDLKDDSKESIAQSDRVELFLRSDYLLDPYYCLEIDTQPRVMDFIARPNRDFDLGWSWPAAGIEVKSAIDEQKFSVEGKLSLASLKTLNLLKQDEKGYYLEVGVYRAKYTRETTGQNKATWITWVDPQTEYPEFHIKDSFGVFRLEP